MRASRLGVWVEGLEARRLFAAGAAAAAPHAAALAGSSIVLAAVGASMDFLTAEDIVSNASANVVIDFRRGDDTSGNVSVNYTTVDGTAHAGIDYIAKAGTVQFGAGETMKSVTITLIDRPSAPGSQAFTLALTAPSPGAYLGTQTTHTVTLQNDRAPVALAATSYSKSTDDTGVDVAVTRTGNTDIAVSVGYATTDGSAHDGEHYSEVHGTLSFGVGETSKSVHVPLLGDRDAADGVTFGFALSSAADGAGLLGATSAAVTIHNAYSPMQFDDPAYTVTTSFPSVTVVVTRTGNTTGPASVHYATADGTATDALDYTGASGTLNFGPGETVKLVNVALLDNLEAAGDTAFS